MRWKYLCDIFEKPYHLRPVRKEMGFFGLGGNLGFGSGFFQRGT